MLNRRVLVLLLAAVLGVDPISAQNIEESQGEEAILSFEFPSGGVSAIIIGRIVKGRLFLPVADIFETLGIEVKVGISGTGVTGFFVSEDTPYEINAKSLKADVKGQSFRLAKDDFVLVGASLYLVPAVYEKLFHLCFSVDMSRLVLSLETSVYLPVVAVRDRERNARFLATIEPGRQQYPLMYPRSQHLYNGTILDYSLTAASSSGRQSLAYDLRAGAELLYGDFQIGALGTYEPDLQTGSTVDVRWRHAFKGLRSLTQLSVGDLVASGVQQYQFRGIQLSNEPLQPREFYQSYLIEETTVPGWTAELYLNEQLAGVAKADAQGHYRFNIPLTYGTTEYTIRLYGPSGEARTQRHRLQIPFTIVPPGEVIYTVNAGQTKQQGDRMLQGSLAAGLTKFLTWNAGLEEVRDSLSSLLVASTGLTLRLGETYTIGLQASPSFLYRGEINAIYASQTSFASSLAFYNRNPFYNPSDRVRDVQGSFSLPLYTPSASYSARLSGGRTNYSTGVFDRADIAATVSTGPTISTLEFQGTRSQVGSEPEVLKPLVQASILQLISFDRFGLGFLDVALAGISAGYDLHRNNWDNVLVDLSASVFQHGRLQLSVRHDFGLATSSTSLQFVYELGGSRSTTSALFDGSQAYSQNIRGSVFVNNALTYRRFFDREWVGKSGARFRSYLDYNGNGIFDPGEKLLTGINVNLNRAFATQQVTPTARYAWDLLPYNRYEVDVNDVGIENTVWIPRQRSFLFVTEPNVLKPIDIPFDAVGTIEGTVLKKTPTGMQPVPGLRLRVARINGSFRKAIPVFQDGSVYFMGIPPGWYTACVDSTQLRILGLRSVPGIIAFGIRNTRDGDYVGTLNFILDEEDGKKY
ncbi:MAG: hypothetical protein NTZ35_07320 [Ignavibacteriales bacterium]|nr:hypothetical protein [Ignavibacteriales bacterium]